MNVHPDVAPRVPGLPSVLLPVAPRTCAAALPFVGLVARSGAGRLWMGQTASIDAHHLFAYAAGGGLRVPVGTSVGLMPLQHPWQAAHHARSLAAVTGMPVVAGLGVADPTFLTALYGSPLRRPAAYAAEYLTIMRALLDDGRVEHRGEHFTVSAALPPLPHTQVELGLAVLRPGLAAVAGRLADVAITLLTPPDYIAGVLSPALRDGAGARPVPRVATLVPFAVARPGRDPRRVALHGHAAHLTLRHYAATLRAANVPVDVDEPVAGAAALVDHGVFLTGTPEEIAVELDRYRAAGVDEIVLNPAGTVLTDGIAAAVADLEDVLGAVQRRLAA